MVIFYAILIFLFLIDTRPRICNSEVNLNYLDKNNSTIVKGFFVLLVFFRHISSYINLDCYKMTDYLYLLIDSYSMQLIVTMFFFYSGYGIVEQVKEKGKVYIDNFFFHRFLPVFLSFVICVLFYQIYNFLMKIYYPIKSNLLSFIGWESVGNSNWFMFDTFVLYLLILVVFKLIRENLLKQVGVVSCFIIFLIGILIVIKKSICWYDTLLCFSLGLWWSLFKTQIENLIRNKHWVLIFLCSIFCFCGFYILSLKISHIFFIIASLFFCSIILLINTKVVFSRSYIFNFLGKHVFSIYILQRLVFLIFQNNLRITNKYVFFVGSLILSVIVASIYDYIFGRIKKVFIYK